MACRTEDGPRGRVFWLNEGGKGPYTVFYLHGGSYIHDFSYFHWRFLKKLIERTDAAVAAPAYALAPWGTWQEAFELILPLFTAYAAAHPERKLILMGDSAGGGLAAAVALELQRTGMRLPDELILLSPWMDVTISDPAIDAFIPRDPWLTPAHRACGRWWAGKLDPRAPRVSPGYGDWDLSVQGTLLDLLSAHKRIGLTLTGGGMLVPEKSITAVVGLSDREEDSCGQKCIRCRKTDCPFRSVLPQKPTVTI